MHVAEGRRPAAQGVPPAQFHGGQFHEVDLVETEVVRVERAYPHEGDEKNFSHWTLRCCKEVDKPGNQYDDWTEHRQAQQHNTSRRGVTRDNHGCPAPVIPPKKDGIPMGAAARGPRVKSAAARWLPGFSAAPSCLALPRQPTGTRRRPSVLNVS